VDDTALTANVAEIEQWVSSGAVTLIIPLYSTSLPSLCPAIANTPALERLHLLKKDASQIGQNARKSVKFLDRMTSGKLDLPCEPIIIQQSEQQYATWAEVEAHYNETPEPSSEEKPVGTKTEEASKSEDKTKRTSTTPNALSQMLLDKLNFAPASPTVTPPLSPSPSEPQSTKTSPEVTPAAMNATTTPVPEILKPLLNPVVWYVHSRPTQDESVFFLTNSADTQHLARDFSVPTKTIHQLRNILGVQPAPQPERSHKKQRSISSLLGAPADDKEKTLFSYDDASSSSDDEKVVFKPRGRGARTPARGHGTMRNKHTSSPRLSFTSPANSKPQIPIEEIDPDSFDRGSFGRGRAGVLADTGSPVVHSMGHHMSGPGGRFGDAPRGPMRGGFSPGRGFAGTGLRSGRGFERGGSGRGRGRLFVP
jgi:hypothetical protein